MTSIDVTLKKLNVSCNNDLNLNMITSRVDINTNKKKYKEKKIKKQLKMYLRQIL